MPPIFQEFFHHLSLVMAMYALGVVGQPYLLGLYRFFRSGTVNIDTLTDHRRYRYGHGNRCGHRRPAGLHGDIEKIVNAISLSRFTMRTIKQNLFWAFIYNIVSILLAAGLLYPFFDWLLSPVFAGLAMAFSSVSVVGNLLRLKTKKR